MIFVYFSAYFLQSVGIREFFTLNFALKITVEEILFREIQPFPQIRIEIRNLSTSKLDDNVITSLHILYRTNVM